MQGCNWTVSDLGTALVLFVVVARNDWGGDLSAVIAALLTCYCHRDSYKPSVAALHSTKPSLTTAPSTKSSVHVLHIGDYIHVLYTRIKCIDMISWFASLTNNQHHRGRMFRDIQHHCGRMFRMAGLCSSILSARPSSLSVRTHCSAISQRLTARPFHSGSLLGNPTASHCSAISQRLNARPFHTGTVLGYLTASHSSAIQQRLTARPSLGVSLLDHHLSVSLLDHLSASHCSTISQRPTARPSHSVSLLGQQLGHLTASHCSASSLAI